MDWRDAMHDHCRQLGLLVELLEACGQPLEAEVVEGIGRALHRDVAAMQALMHQLDIAAERATRPGRKEGR